VAENVNANIRIDLDSSEAVAGLKALQSQISSFNKAVVTSNAAAVAAQKSMMNTLIAQVGATHQFSTSIANVETSVGRLGKSIDRNKLSLGEYFKYGIAASGRFGRIFEKQQKEIVDLASDRVKRLQTQYLALGDAQNGMTKALAVRPLNLFNADSAISIQRMQLFNKLLRDGSTSLINWGKNTQWAGRQLMVGFTVPLTIFGGMAGKIFMDLEKQIVKFRRVYGDATTPLEETDAMIAQIQELSKEYTKYGIAVSDTIALAGDAAAAGAQGEALISATSQATRLATLGMIDQQQALDATIALQSAFRLSNEQLAESVNFLNAVENQTVVSLDDITQAIPLVAPVIQGLGGDVQDLAIFMAAMREGGVNASEGANALKSGLASLINPTKAAREQLNKGTLCNMTDGGDGTVGRIMSEEEKNNVRKRITKEFYEAGVKFAAQVNKIPVVQLTKTGEFIKTWNSASDAAKTLFDGNGISLIRSCCKGIRKSAKGFAWKNYKDYIYECN